MRRSPDGAGVAGSKAASEKSPLMSSTDHQRPVSTSTVTTVGLPRAYASARAVRRVARKSPVAEAKLPRDLRRLSAIADMPASTPAMATVMSISTSVKPLARRRCEPRAVILPPRDTQSRQAGEQATGHRQPAGFTAAEAEGPTKCCRYILHLGYNFFVRACRRLRPLLR